MSLWRNQMAIFGWCVLPNSNTGKKIQRHNFSYHTRNNNKLLVHCSADCCVGHKRPQRNRIMVDHFCCACFTSVLDQEKIYVNMKNKRIWAKSPVLDSCFLVVLPRTTSFVPNFQKREFLTKQHTTDTKSKYHNKTTPQTHQHTNQHAEQRIEQTTWN